MNTALFPAAAAAAAETAACVPKETIHEKTHNLFQELPRDPQDIIFEMAGSNATLNIAAQNGKFSNDGRYFTSVDPKTHILSVIDTRTQKQIRTLSLGNLRDLAFSDDGSVVAASFIRPYATFKVDVYKATGSTYTLYHSLPDTWPTERGLAVSGDGTTLAYITAGRSTLFVIHDLTTKRELHRKESNIGGGRPPHCGERIALSHTGSRIALFNSNYNAVVFDKATGEIIRELPFGRLFSHLTLSGDGNTIACHDDGGTIVYHDHSSTISLWDVTTGKSLPTCTDTDARAAHIHLCGQPQLDFTGKRLVTKTHDGVVKLWDTQTGAAIKKLCIPALMPYNLSHCPYSPALAGITHDIILPNPADATMMLCPRDPRSGYEQVMNMESLRPLRNELRKQGLRSKLILALGKNQRNKVTLPLSICANIAGYLPPATPRVRPTSTDVVPVAAAAAAAASLTADQLRSAITEPAKPA
jgi:hypothetical protein